MSDDLMISPLDGRYRPMVAPLAGFLSERMLNRTRVEVEVRWFLHLARSRVCAEMRELTAEEVGLLERLVDDFDSDQAAELRAIEGSIGHDVKAVEYYVKRALATTTLSGLSEFVHFGCTSEDINNLAYARMLQRTVGELWLPAATTLVDEVHELAVRHRDRAMLSRTHGQAATPTTVGKELAVFVHRMRRQLRRIAGQEYLGKFNGATGTFGAHTAAVPGADWIEISRSFVEGLGLTWNPLTTQIESHDYMGELFADMSRFNGILHNFDTDMWQYIGIGLFRQAATADAVGSSTMPHKINPIRFENSEANLEMSNSLLYGLQASLVTSRMQRDLSDSSTQRNIGPAIAYGLIGIENARRGLAGLTVDPVALDRDLDQAWEVLGEAVQSVMRRNLIDQPYERLKELTRGIEIDKAGLHEFVLSQKLPAHDEDLLLSLTPATYTGLASRLVDFIGPPQVV